MRSLDSFGIGVILGIVTTITVFIIFSVKSVEKDTGMLNSKLNEVNLSLEAENKKLDQALKDTEKALENLHKINLSLARDMDAIMSSNKILQKEIEIKKKALIDTEKVELSNNQLKNEVKKRDEIIDDQSLFIEKQRKVIRNSESLISNQGLEINKVNKLLNLEKSRNLKLMVKIDLLDRKNKSMNKAVSSNRWIGRLEGASVIAIFELIRLRF